MVQLNHVEEFRMQITTMLAMRLSEQLLSLGTVVGVFHILNSYVSPQLPKLVTIICPFLENSKAARYQALII